MMGVKQSRPCGDCDDGYCTMNCGPAINLPEGWTWDRVRAERATWGLSDDLIPVAVVPGRCVGWVNYASIIQTKGDAK